VKHNGWVLSYKTCNNQRRERRSMGFLEDNATIASVREKRSISEMCHQV
jgi:hypothetical protein